MEDLTIESLKKWRDGDTLPKIKEYSPYYEEIVLFENGGSRSAIIDGQPRITTVLKSYHAA